MQKGISIILFGISIFLLYISLSHCLQTQSETIIPDSSLSSGTNPEDIQYSARELGCSSSATTPSSLYAKAYCVMDADSGRILCSKNAEKQMPMASTTKIMTCILALEQGNLSDTVSVSSYAASMPDVQLNIREGESYLLEDLLYSLMLESHNDTAVAIAEHLGGSVEGFAELMNQKAQDLGCTNTHFVTPNGLDHEEHYTTAAELCLIASYAIQNEDFLKIIGTSSYSFKEQTGKRSFTVNNHDAFLGQYSGAIGIKTGFTGNAGYCFCGAARRDGRTLVSSVLACGWPPNKSYKWADTKKLMDFGFEGYETVSIPINQSEIIQSVTDGQQGTLSVKRNKEASPSLLLTSSDRITIHQELPEKINAPVRAGDIVGYEKYAVNGTTFLEIPLTAEKNIKKIDYKYWIHQLSKLFLVS
ncbi:MAG: D-alanyl-D-alanine carboxypeptidase [Lachnospiraceae bacterium]|nr:D-alanyl-D-alanine carboxypeptidase [Lachnospiraceae bacterium]